jgi:hypothetical protein
MTNSPQTPDLTITQAQLAPGPSFALGFMLFLKPFTFAKDL